MLRLTDQGFRRVAAAQASQQSLIDLLDGEDITLVTPLAGIRENDERVLTFPYPVAEQP